MRLDLICTKDELRPTMNHVKVNAKECIATNAYILGVIPSENIFNDDFIKELGDRTILIHRDDWKHIKPGVVIYWKGEDMIAFHLMKGGKRDTFIQIETEETVGKYPNWEAVVPELNNNSRVDLNTISLNAGLMVDLQKALNFISSELHFYGANKAIGVHNGNNKETLLKDTKNKGNYGIIMPTMKN